MSSVFAIIPAAGSSQRMNTPESKVRVILRGRSVLERAVEPFVELSIPVIVMVRESDRDEITRLLERFESVSVVIGGATRGESVSRGLSYLREHCAPAAGDIVLVHDAARCLVSTALINAVISGVESTGAAVPGLAINDTLKRVGVNGSVITDTVDRVGLYSVQTPQGFRFELLDRAYRSGELAATDDAALVEKSAPVSIVEGSPFNIKITRPSDIELAESFLALREKQSVG